MEIKAALNKPYTEKQKLDFIVEQNHKNGYIVQENELALEAWGETEEEQAQKVKEERIAKLKRLLTDTDYKAIKYSEGLISEEEYAETKAQRQAWRDEINQLEVTE